MEPTSYCGACFGHVHCENFALNAEDPVKLFKRNEIDEDTFWLDMKNCSGIVHVIISFQYNNYILFRSDRFPNICFITQIGNS